jgi:hypothetical protein
MADNPQNPPQQQNQQQQQNPPTAPAYPSDQPGSNSWLSTSLGQVTGYLVSSVLIAQIPGGAGFGTQVMGNFLAQAAGDQSKGIATSTAQSVLDSIDALGNDIESAFEQMNQSSFWYVDIYQNLP